MVFCCNYLKKINQTVDMILLAQNSFLLKLTSKEANRIHYKSLVLTSQQLKKSIYNDDSTKF